MIVHRFVASQTHEAQVQKALRKNRIFITVEKALAACFALSLIPSISTRVLKAVVSAESSNNLVPRFLLRAYAARLPET